MRPKTLGVSCSTRERRLYSDPLASDADPELADSEPDSDVLDSLSDESESPLASIITGTESSVSSSSSLDDDITPFPSPVLSAKSLAGLSRA